MNNSTEKLLLDKLCRGLKQLGEDPGRHPCEQYLAYIDLLYEWNRAYNLTAVRDRGEMLIKHVLDSLTALPFIRGTECLDIATGAGMPGFLLALARPDQQWTLLDSNFKKIRFLDHAVLRLVPGNIDVVRTRLEDYQPLQRFDTVITRAYATLKKFHDNASSLLNKDGRLIAMKGRKPAAELSELAENHIHADIHEVTLPETDIVRNIVVMNNQPGRAIGPPQ